MAVKILFKPSFIRQYKKLPDLLKAEVKRAIDLLSHEPENQSLNVHKLQGRLQGCFSLSVNYRYRIIFEYEVEKTAVLLAVGDHDIYR